MKYIVGTHIIFNAARIKVKHGFLVELPEIAENTALQYLIPTTTGPGICSFALVDYLVVQHNSFMEMCQGVMSEEDKRYLVTLNLKCPFEHCNDIHLHI